MYGRLEQKLTIGGKSNSLGKVNEVIQEVLQDKSLLVALYDCMKSEDAWVRMRAADTFEKICRERPEWIEPFIDRIQDELSGPKQQPSIQWHIAQIYREVSLTDTQKERALNWLVDILSKSSIDWIVAANSMDTLAYFTRRGGFDKNILIHLLNIQRHHRSNAVIRKANKILTEFQ